MTTLTTREAATALGLTARSVAALARRGLFVARPATPDEIAALLAEGRIRSVPPTGVLLLEDAEVARYQAERRPAHRPAGQS